MGAKVYALPVPQSIDRGLARVVPIPKKTKYGVQEALNFEWPRSYSANALQYTDRPTARVPGEMFDMQPTSRDDLPSAYIWSQRMVTAVVEVVTGLRSASQLTRWLTPEVMMHIHELKKTHYPERLGIVAVRVTEPDDGVAEVSATIGTKQRSFAIALRLEGLDGRWRGTTLVWGA